MNKLFRQVKSRERRPKKNDTYPTSRGDCLYHVNLDGFVNDMGFRINPEYWYEPVEIPTDEEFETARLAYNSFSPKYGYIYFTRKLSGQNRNDTPFVYK